MLRGVKHIFLCIAVILLAACSVPEQKRPPKKQPPPAAPAAEQPAPPPAEKPRAYRGDLKPFVVAAKASSDDGADLVAELAFDGDPETRWSSGFADREWIEGTFDRPVAISEVTIRWETARATDFSVSLLNMQSNWTEVAYRADGVGPMDRLSFPSAIRARGIRILCIRRATEWGNSIYEVDMTGIAEGQPPEKNLTQFEVPPTPEQARERAIAKKLLAEAKADPPSSEGMTDAAFLDLVAKRAFYYFWYETNPSNGLTRDRGRNFKSSEDATICSVAASGFGLTAYAIGAEHGWVTREEALERVRVTLRTFARGPIRNVKGFFPHFVDMTTGQDSPGTEISTIDTALFLAGLVTAVEYFKDEEVAALGREIYERVDWPWARNGHPHFVTHGLDAAGKFFPARWGTTTEGILVYLLAMGSPTYPLPGSSWDAIDRHTGAYEGYRYIVEYGFQSIFRYQYPALWYDFRGRTDRKGVDFFENATLATLGMRQYCIDQAKDYPKSYGPDSWGLGAADGPGDRYMIYGFPPGNPYSPTDGSVVPYAIAGSLPFLPQHGLRALRKLYDEHREAWGKYGFADSLNPQQDFVTRDALGLDAGTVLLGIENYRSRFVWRLFMKNAWIQQTTARIGWKSRPRSTDPAGPVDLARDCRWKTFKGDGAFSAADFDDKDWASVALPDRMENIPQIGEYDGVAWFRTEFNVDPVRLSAWNRAGQVVLTLGAVDDADAAYINGTKVGETLEGPDTWDRERRYTLSPGILKAGRNVLAIRVTDAKGYGGIWKTPMELGTE